MAYKCTEGLIRCLKIFTHGDQLGRGQFKPQNGEALEGNEFVKICFHVKLVDTSMENMFTILILNSVDVLAIYSRQLLAKCGT